MRLDDELDAAEVGWGPVRRAPQQLGQREHAGRDLRDPRIIRQEFGRVTAPNREAGGFQANYRRSGRHVGVQDVQCRAQLASGAVELTRADPGQAAAGWSFHEPRRVAGRSQHRDGRCDGVAGEAVGEGVHPHDRGVPGRLRNRNPPARRDRSESRQGASLVDACGPADQPSNPGVAVLKLTRLDSSRPRVINRPQRGSQPSA